MSEFIEQLLKEVRERLAASRAAVTEYERLQRALTALGGVDGDSTPPQQRPQPARVSSRGSRRPKAQSAAPRGANRDRILAFVTDPPGVTREEIQSLSALSAAVVSQNLRRMVSRGELREQALPGGQTGYALGSGEPATTSGSNQGTGEAGEGAASGDPAAAADPATGTT